MMSAAIKILAVYLIFCISAGFGETPEQIEEEQRLAHQVFLINSTQAVYCIASILDETHILTSSYCALGFPELWKNVLIDTNDKDHGVNKLYGINGTSFYDDGHYNDIAILKLDTPIAFNDTIKPIKLPIHNIANNTLMKFSGPGDLQFSPDVPLNLHNLNMTTISNRDCNKETIGFKIKPRLVCTRDEDSDSGLIKLGDSPAHFGGSLIANNTIYGIYAVNATEKNSKYRIFSRVFFYVPWINHHLRHH